MGTEDREVMGEEERVNQNEGSMKKPSGDLLLCKSTKKKYEIQEGVGFMAESMLHPTAMSY